MFSEINDYRKAYGQGIIRGGLTFSDNILSYLIGKTPSRGPLYVDWEVTYACNFRCSYCNCWSMAEPDKELDTQQALKVIRGLAEAKVWLLIFTGGEPLIRPDLDQLIKEAKRLGMNVGINTNGSLLAPKAEMIMESGVDSLTVTAESTSPELHDRIRNFPQAFDKLLEGIDRLKELRKGKKPRINIRMDITKENYKEIKPYIEFWSPKVDGIILQPIHQTEKTEKYKSTEDMRFAEKDEREFGEYFNDITKQKKFSNLYYKEIPTFFFDPDSLYHKYRCFAAYAFGQIDPYGNVYSCTEYMENFGNLKEASFKDIWKGEKAKKFRKIIKDRKFTCKCWYYCTGPVNTNLSKIFRIGK
jgi:radical SAM protein with 4Fe4S-binding SPASM domain